jgi:hypothetical protein
MTISDRYIRSEIYTQQEVLGRTNRFRLTYFFKQLLISMLHDNTIHKQSEQTYIKDFLNILLSNPW